MACIHKSQLSFLAIVVAIFVGFPRRFAKRLVWNSKVCKKEICLFQKKTQKTSKEDIEIAKKRYQEIGV